MLDLSSLGKVFKGEPQPAAKPVVAALVVREHAPALMEQVTKALKDNGWNTDKVTKNEDGTITFAQTDDLTGGKPVRVSNELILVVKGFDMSNVFGDDNAEFADIMTGNGFYGGLNNAFDALYATVAKSLNGATTPDDASTPIKKALGAFSGYVSELVASLPASAFKADTAIHAVIKKGLSNPEVPAKPSGVAQNDWDKLDAGGKLQWIKDSTNTPGNGSTQKGADVETAKKLAPHVGGNNSILMYADIIPKSPPPNITQNDWDKLDANDKIAAILTFSASNTGTPHAGPTYKAEDRPADVAVEVWDKMADADKGAAIEKSKAVKTAGSREELMQKLLGTITAQFTDFKASIGNQVQAIATKVEGQATEMAKIVKTVDETARKSDTALQTLKTTVAAGAGAGDTPAAGGAEKVVKQDPRSGAFDTGMMRRNAVKRAV